AADLYGFGAVMCEMVGGAVAPGALDRVDARWRKAIGRCLDRDPNARFRMAGEVVDEIGRAPALPKWWMGVAAAVACAAVLAVPAGRKKAFEASAYFSRSVAEYFEPDRAVAVLPFSHEPGPPAPDPLSLGLIAAVSDRLGTWTRGHELLYVVPAAETVNAGVDTAALAKLTLGVNAIVEGRMLEDGNRRRVVVQLHEIADDGASSKVS